MFFFILSERRVVRRAVRVMVDFQRNGCAKVKAFDKLSEAIEQYKQALKAYDEVATMMGESHPREREAAFKELKRLLAEVGKAP